MHLGVVGADLAERRLCAAPLVDVKQDLKHKPVASLQKGVNCERESMCRLARKTSVSFRLETCGFFASACIANDTAPMFQRDVMS